MNIPPRLRSISSKSLLSLLLITLLLPACSPPAPDLPPEEIVTRAADRMKTASGFHFVIDRQGAPAFLDPTQTLSFRRAEGDYTAPDRAQATVRVIVPGLVVEIQAIAIGDQYWETHFLTGEWQPPLPADLAFNPALLFDAQTGLPAILQTSLTNLSLAGVVELEDLPGLKLYHLTGTLDATRLYELSYTLIGPNPVQTDLWISPETFDVYRIQLTEPPAAEGGESTLWRVDFWDIGKTVEISPPTIAPD